MSGTTGVETVALIPALNEAERVSNVIHAAFRANLVDAVVVVDDGSTDETVSVIERAAKEEMAQSSKPFIFAQHIENQGKTEALLTGVNEARQLGGTALSTLVFLDADSSPIWSRYTKENMKLWQLAVNVVSDRVLDDVIMEGRNDVFQNLLARYIDEIVEPVHAGREVMRVGMYQRNIVTDTFLTIFNVGGHAGNRAIRIDLWDDMLADAENRGLQISGWEIEGSLISYLKKLEKAGESAKEGNFMMDGVVNVGSRIKAGGFLAGVKRMLSIHSKALQARLKF